MNLHSLLFVMTLNELPKMNMTTETGCCPKFDPGPWDEQEFVFEDKLFAVGKTWNFFHIPLNIGSMFTKMLKKIMDEGAAPSDYYLTLSYDPSMWRGEHFFAVEKEIPGVEMRKLSGRYLTKVFEGPFKDAGNWAKQMEEYVTEKNETLKKLYFFYTTCPKCAKHYGKNYVVGFAEV